MSTPGRRRALRALAARRRSNKRRIKAGKRPVLNDRKGRPRRVSVSTFRARTRRRRSGRGRSKSRRRR